MAAGVLATGSWAVLVPEAGAQATSTGQSIESAAAGRISVAEFKKLHDAGAVIVIDVRPRDAYEQGHIPGALHVPLDWVARRAPEWRGVDRAVVTYCT
jgi:3-mercaptopyruvate sulfurtransferase SseA